MKIIPNSEFTATGHFESLEEFLMYKEAYRTTPYRVFDFNWQGALIHLTKKTRKDMKIDRKNIMSRSPLARKAHTYYGVLS